VEESFGLAIQDHLALQRRNRGLEQQMPLARYREAESMPPAAPAPLAGSVRTAVGLEDTQEWTFSGHDEPLLPPAEDIWVGPPAFDWGD
jgi:hypothetical protein